MKVTRKMWIKRHYGKAAEDLPAMLMCKEPERDAQGRYCPAIHHIIHVDGLAFLLKPGECKPVTVTFEVDEGSE